MTIQRFEASWVWMLYRKPHSIDVKALPLILMPRKLSPTRRMPNAPITRTKAICPWWVILQKPAKWWPVTSGKVTPLLPSRIWNSSNNVNAHCLIVVMWALYVLTRRAIRQASFNTATNRASTTPFGPR